MNNILLKILNKRGIIEIGDIEEFLSSNPKLTYDPFLLSQMEEGVDLILDHIKRDKNICIYGDYDSDGITSISILKTILDKLSNKVSYYIPNRFDQGYGLNKKSIEKLKNEGIDLIVTVDCGITAYEEVEFCKALGMDIIVTDHHNVEGKIPDCIVIDPKKPNCQYPFKFLAGCGVAFKLFQGIQRKANLDRNIIKEVLDIVAIGTIGDIVPLVDENRTLVKYGLLELNRKMRLGVKKLKDRILNSKEILDAQDISFFIVPHLNAAGRIEDAKIGVSLFLEKDEEKLNKVVDKIIELNIIRKNLQEDLFNLCKEEYHREYETKKFPIIKLENAHEGVTGIVAGKMKDYINRPVAIVTNEKEGDFFKGTSRSIKSIDIFQVLSQSKDLFNKFGGHKGACGFSIESIKYLKLVEKVDKTMENFTKEDFVAEKEYDLEIYTHDLSIAMAKELDKIQPCGEANPLPKFMFRNCIVKNIVFMGKNENHARLEIISEDKLKFDKENNIGENIYSRVEGTVNCILFNIKDDIKSLLKINRKIDVIATLNINKWNNKESLQILAENVDIP